MSKNNDFEGCGCLLVILVLVFLGLGYEVSEILYLALTIIILPLILLGVCIVFFQWLYKAARRSHIKSTLDKFSMSDDRNDYYFSSKDYKRGNLIDNYYRKKYFMLIAGFNCNRCLRCDSMESITLDHFMFSKNEGGNFVLRHTSGLLINNGIPICQACNSAKGDKSYRDFFSLKQIENIININRIASNFLNNDEVLKRLIQKYYS